MRLTVIGIAGHAKSGKSTLAQALSDRLALPRVSFGTEIRKIAGERGEPVTDPARATERAVLMRHGEHLVAHETEMLCRRVIAQANWRERGGVIIDGIRHVVVVETLRRILSPVSLFLILVDTSANEREQRFVDAGLGPLTRAVMDAHSTEREIPDEIALLADQVVDGAVDASVTVDAVVAAIEARSLSRGVPD